MPRLCLYRGWNGNVDSMTQRVYCCCEHMSKYSCPKYRNIRGWGSYTWKSERGRVLIAYLGSHERGKRQELLSLFIRQKHSQLVTTRVTVSPCYSYVMKRRSDSYFQRVVAISRLHSWQTAWNTMDLKPITRVSVFRPRRQEGVPTRPFQLPPSFDTTGRR